MARWTAGLVAAWLLAAPAPGQDAAAVVQKAVAAHGGAETLNKYPANVSKMAGKLSIFGMDVAMTGTMSSSVPGKVKLDMTLDVSGQKVAIVQVVNGDKVKQTQNGKPEKLSDIQEAELKQMGPAQEVSLLTPLLDAKKYTLGAEKDADVGGNPAAVVTVKAKGLKDLKLFFDKKTGLLVQMERKGLDPASKEVTEVTRFSDYKDVKGLKVPMKSVVEHDGKPFLTLTVTEYTPLEKIDDKEFSLAD